MFADPDQLRYDLLDWITPETREGPEADAVDQGDYEIYKHKLDTVLEEAQTTFKRTGISSMLKSGDVIVGLHNIHGDLVTASCGTYLHGPIAQLPVKFIINHHLTDESNVTINPGDIFYANEVLTGGLHNPDQMAIMPIFNDGEHIAWATAALHQPETGAIEPGGMPETARSRYEEGMRLTPIKIAEDYEIRDDLMDMMKNFILRAPKMQETDVHARCTAVNVIRKRVQEIAEETSNAFLEGVFQRSIAEAETGARNTIASLSDGTYRSVAFFDNIGAEEALVKVQLELEKRDDELFFDFSGTSPQAGSYNTFAHGVPAFLASYLFPYVFYDLPVSTGAFAPFSFEIPDRSLVNAEPEASVSQCVMLGTVIMSLCHDAFGRMLYATNPDRVAGPPNTHEGGGAGYDVGVDKYGNQQASMDSFAMNTMGGGARTNADGVDALGFNYAPWGKARNHEEREEEGVFFTLSGGHLADSGGPGKYRGGNGTQSVNIVISDNPIRSGGRGKGARIPSGTGMFGGYAESSLLRARISNANVLEKLRSGEDISTDIRTIIADEEIEGDYEIDQLGIESRKYDKGDVLMGMSSGGGGIGDPLERDPELVRNDLEEGMITEWTARNVYKVAIDDGSVNQQKTRKLREDTRQQRMDDGVPFDEFITEWESKQPPEEILEYYGEWPNPQNS